MAWRAGGLVLKPLDISMEALAWQEAVLSGIAAAIFRAVMDRLCNPRRHEPPWWTSLLHVTAQLCHLAASAPTAAISPRSSGKPCGGSGAARRLAGI